ncbi:MAG: hypothetical protein AAGA99_12165 [Actinomycetota bacterium]
MEREPLLTRFLFPLAIWAALRVGIDLSTDDLDQILERLLNVIDGVIAIGGIVAARRRTRPLDATGAPI